MSGFGYKWGTILIRLQQPMAELANKPFAVLSRKSWGSVNEQVEPNF